MRDSRTLYAEALDALLRDHVARVAVARDWELLEEVARLASQDAPIELATTDPALYTTWRAAVTRFHVAGWTLMTPARVAEVAARERSRAKNKRWLLSSLGVI